MSHTELDLQAAIKEVLEKEIVPHISIFDKGEMKVYLQDIPIDNQYEEDDDKYYPCCIVKLRGGITERPDEPQLTTVETVVVVKDWSKDMSGYKALMICIQRIRDYFLGNAGIKGKFRLNRPVKFVINEEAAIPYFVGSVTTKWDIETMPFNDPLNYL